MKAWRKYLLTIISVLVIAASMPLLAKAQDRPVVLAGAELSRVVPPGFYFQGLSAPTQMRNSAAARFGKSRYTTLRKGGDFSCEVAGFNSALPFLVIAPVLV